jgi:hypothetical protein
MQFDFGTIDPFVVDGVTLASMLNQWRDALHSLHRGANRPAYAVPGMLWINDSGGAANWVVNKYMSPAIGDLPLLAVDTVAGTIRLSDVGLGTPPSGDLANCTGLPEGGLTLSDVVTGDVSAARHGWAPKLPGDPGKFLNGVGGYTAPTSSSGIAGGRLTLSAGTPVLTGNVTGAGTIYYSPYVSGQVPIWSGTGFLFLPIVELSNVLANSTVGSAGPAAVVANSNYDLFIWDAAAPKLTRGPAWASDAVRGAGAGTTELQRVNGILTNKNVIANGPAAGFGTYVGTIRTNGTATVDWKPHPAYAAGGGNAFVGVFNAYNRVAVTAVSADSTLAWSYATPIWRMLNNSSANRASYIDGLGEMEADVACTLASGHATVHFVGVNRDATAGAPTNCAAQTWNSNFYMVAIGSFAPSLGFHYLQAMEWDSSGAASTQYGSGTHSNGGNAISQSQFLRVSLTI